MEGAEKCSCETDINQWAGFGQKQKTSSGMSACSASHTRYVLHTYFTGSQTSHSKTYYSAQ